MKKRFMSVLIAALLIMSMCVTASAASYRYVFVKTSPNGGGFWTVIPDFENKGDSSDSGSSGSSSSSTNTNSGYVVASTPAKDPVFTTPTGQPITDSLIQVLGASSESTGAVLPVSKTTVIAYSNYLKMLGFNSALVTAFVPMGAAGKSTITNGLIAKGMSYTVLVQRPTGQVEFVAPKSVANGKLTYNKPAGAIASIAVVANAVAPK